MKNSLIPVALILGFTLGFAATPVDAQGRSKKDRDRAEEQRRGDWEDGSRAGDWDDRIRTGDWGRDDLRRRGNGSGKVPPGWCRGVGNPHNTVANCGYAATNAPRRSGSPNRGGSYEQAHAEFHRELDYRYERLASQRPLDIQYQIELRARKRAEHDEWHRRTGIPH